MMKLLLLVAVIAIAVWMVTARQRKPPPRSQPKRQARPTPAQPVAMLACAHCGVHLPQDDAVLDAGGQPFCSSAHRLAGPR